MSRIDTWKQWARLLRREAYTLYFAFRDPRTPWYARAVAAAVAAYALSPIDLIPDPIPVLGHLDDLLIVPLGVWLARKLIPPDVLAAARATAEAALAKGGRRSWAGAAVIVLIWLAILALVGWWTWRLLARRGIA